METVRQKAISRSHSARLYRIRCVLWLLLWLLLGSFVAYTEYAQWFPRLFSDLMRIDRMSSAVLGACLTQTAAIPLVFVLGLHRSSYFHTSRTVCGCFGFLHGVELFNVGIAVRSVAAFIPFVLLLIPVLLLMLNAVTRAAQGTTVRHGMGTPIFSYCYHALRLWGALLIVQFIFNLFVLWIA